MNILDSGLKVTRAVPDKHIINFLALDVCVVLLPLICSSVVNMCFVVGIALPLPPIEECSDLSAEDTFPGFSCFIV